MARTKPDFSPRPSQKPRTVSTSQAYRNTGKQETVNLKKMTVEIPEDLHKELKIAAVDEGRKIREIITDLVTDYLEARKTVEP